MATNQFVVFTREFGKPLVKLQHGYNGHQIPEMQDREERFTSVINVKLSGEMSDTHLFSRWLKSCKLSSLVSCVK